MANVCFVVTCMGRLSHLKQTLPSLLAHEDTECVVVDYSCPDGSGDWVEAHHSQAKVVRVPGHAVFNKSSAINHGVEATRAPWIGLVDADYWVEPRYFRKLQERLEPRHYYFSRTPVGFLLCPRKDFIEVGGADELYRGWGEEDLDIRQALHTARLRGVRIPAGRVREIEHEDDLRTRHYLDGKKLSQAINRLYRLVKFDVMSMTGSRLSLDTRRRIYGSAESHMRRAFERRRGRTRLEVAVGGDLTEHEFSADKGWSLRRTLSYEVRF